MLNENDKELIKLLQDLVNIPSWLPEEKAEKLRQNENKVVDYIKKWLKQNTGFSVERQILEGGRYNLIAKKGEPDLVLLGHTDTVSPSQNSPYNPFGAEIHNGKIWGLGTVDMKSGIAAILQAIKLSPNFNNVWAFFYADEEYDFLGMKALVEKFKNIKAKLLISADGSDLLFGHGCRGLIEFRVRIYGETGHPARGTGKSAIFGAMKGIEVLKVFLDQYQSLEMDKSSLNVGDIIGGTYLENSLDSKGFIDKVGRAANVVPDVAELSVDIRPSSTELTFKNIIDFVTQYFVKKGFQVEIIEKKHDYGAWYTKKNELKINNAKFEDPGKCGYIDLQMLWEAIGRPPAFTFGGGNGNTAHKSDEHIEIENLIKTRNIFIDIIKQQKKG